MEVSLRVGFKSDSQFPDYKQRAEIVISGDKETVELVKLTIEKMKVPKKQRPGWSNSFLEWFVE